MRFPTAILLGTAAGLLLTTTALNASPGERSALDDPPRFEHITSDDGLSQMNVLEIHQDRLGFMWFVTQDGLDRFDGAEFEHIPNIGGPMWQAPDGRLWVGDRARGLRSVDAASWTLEDLASAENGLSSDRVLDVLPAARGGAWIATEGGLDYVNETLEVERIYPPDGEAESVCCVLETERGLIVAVERRLLLRRDDGGIEELRRLDEDLGSPRALLEDREGNLWVGGTDGLDRFRLDDPAGPLTRFRPDASDPSSIPSGGVSTLLEDRQGRLWAGWLRGGLHYYEPNTNRFQRVDLGDGDSEPVNSLFEDRDGTLWVGLAPGGVYFADPGAAHFDLYRHDPQDPQSLSSNIVLAIEEGPGGDVWIGTWFTGLNRLDVETGRIEHFRHDPDDQTTLGSDRVLGLQFAPSDELWIAFRNEGVDRFDPQSGRFEHFRHDPDDPTSLTHDQVLTVQTGPQDSIWVGTRQGLDRFDAESGGFEHFRHDPENPDDPYGLPHEHVQHLFVHGDDIWVSTWGGGIAQFDPRSRRFKHFRHDPDDPTSLAYDVIRSTYVDSVGRLWVATDGAGLDMRPPDSDGFIHFRAGDGLVHDVVQGVLEDELGRLWIPTNGGLSRYDPMLKAWKSFDATDGLQHAEFNFGAFHRGPSGRLYIGGIQGFNAFDGGSFARVPAMPKAVLTAFEGLGLEIELETEAPFLRQLKLEHWQNAFSFEVAALSYRRADRNRYRYRLDPFDEQWIHAGSRRFASYTNVPPGDYSLRVTAAGNEGVWSDEATLLELHIATPPWRTWWAYSIYASMLCGLIFTFAHWQRREVERQREINRRLRDIDRMKDEFLANTSHELRTPLFGITGLAESLIDGVHGELEPEIVDDLEMISSSGHRLSRLVGDLLDFSKLERGRLEIHPRPVDLHAVTDIVLTLSKPLLRSDAVELRNSVPRELPPAMADEERLQQILHNLIGNAVKFTAEGAIDITARRTGERLELTVSDTGIGIAQEHQERIFRAFEQADASIERSFGGTGLGLAVARGLVEAHEGALKLVSSSGQGSSFSFTLPVADGAHLDGADAGAKKGISTFVSSWTPPTPQPPDPLTTDGAAVPGGARVLIVDDEAVNLRVLANFLADAGHHVSTASNGPDALDALEGEGFDLVLLDVMMPKMSGYEVCRTIRQSHAIEQLPVIFLTAKTQEADRIAGFAEGGNDYLHKPVTKAELLARVSLHLRILEAYREQRAEVKVLSGMLPICASCKMIRDDAGYWNQLETFIREHSEASFTHGLCPACLAAAKAAAS